jgi:hypothetical protein
MAQRRKEGFEPEKPSRQKVSPHISQGGECHLQFVGRAALPRTGVQLSAGFHLINPYLLGVSERPGCYRHGVRIALFKRKLSQQLLNLIFRLVYAVVRVNTIVKRIANIG